MGDPILKFTLSHAAAGSLIISEPDGWKDAVFKLERHSDFHTLVEYFDGSFIFYGNNGVDNGGADFIRAVEHQFGFDTTLVITITASFDSGRNYTTVFSGQLDLSQIEETFDDKIKLPIIRNDLWTKFINRLDTPVNLQSTVDLDGNSITPLEPATIELTSQAIRKLYRGSLKNNTFFINASSSDKYGVLDFDIIDYEEITEVFHYTVGQSDSLPFEKFTMEFDGDYVVNSKITIAYYNWSSILGMYNQFLSVIGNVKVYIQINGQDPIAFTETDVNIPSQTIYLNDGTTDTLLDSVLTEYTYDGTFPLKKNDSIRIYATKQSSGHGTASAYAARLFGIYGEGQEFGAINEDNILNPRNGSGVNQGLWDPSLQTFPSPASQSQFWTLSHDGAIQGVTVKKGWVIRALVNSPGQTVSNWYINAKNITEGKYNLGQSYLNVTASTFLADTRADGFLLHDVAGGICDRITGQQNSFYSEKIGATITNYRSYDDDGCDWGYILIRGLQLRQYYLSTKPFAISFTDWWKGANPILNLSLGYDTVDGNEVIKIGSIEDAFDATISVNISDIRNITRSYDNDYTFNKIHVGYSKWQSEDISGIDDPQTSHYYIPPIKKSGKQLDLISEFIAASLAIETTRRNTKDKSTDYKYDNDTFIISIKSNNNTSPDTFKPELDEDFSSISNLFNYQTRYNSRLTPARNFIRWRAFINGCLQSYTSSKYKFVPGEGNYDMISKLNGSGCDEYTSTLSEKQDIDITTEYLFLNRYYEIEIDMSWSTYDTIRNSRTKAIGVSQTESNHTPFFIKTMEYKFCKSKAKITGWAATDFQLIEL